jgi:hypothetical protein
MSMGDSCMRRLLYGLASVLFVLSGCCTTAEPDVSFEGILPKTEGEFALADPGYAIYDLSKLRIGMTRSEVHNLFSKPHTVKQAPKDEYWEYDWFELYFREGRLVNWFDLPEASRRKVLPSSRDAQRAGAVSPSSRSSQAARQGAFEELLP